MLSIKPEFFQLHTLFNQINDRFNLCVGFNCDGDHNGLNGKGLNKSGGSFCEGL